MEFHKTVRLPAERKQLARVRRFIEQHARKTPACDKEIRDLVLAVDEAVTNVIVHGYRDGEGEIEVSVRAGPGQITVTILDRAPLFDPTSVPAPDLKLPLHERPVGGMGVHLIRTLVDHFTHSARPEGGNELKLVKYLGREKGD